MPWVTPYQEFEKNLSQPLDITKLPPYRGKEVWLGQSERPAGILVNRLGYDEQCVFEFELDRSTKRLVAWRFASKGNAAECYSDP